MDYYLSESGHATQIWCSSGELKWMKYIYLWATGPDRVDTSEVKGSNLSNMDDITLLENP